MFPSATRTLAITLASLVRAVPVPMTHLYPSVDPGADAPTRVLAPPPGARLATNPLGEPSPAKLERVYRELARVLEECGASELLAGAEAGWAE